LIVLQAFFPFFSVAVLHAPAVFGALALLFSQVPPRRALAATLLVVLTTSAAERFGQTYGLFGVKYHYLPEAWPPGFARTLPWAVPWMWFAGMVPTHFLARALSASPPRIVLWGAALMVAWDLLLDPVSVQRGLWAWEGGPHPYYGVPLENLAAWAVGTAACHAILLRVLGPMELSRSSLGPAAGLYLGLGAASLAQAREWGLLVPAGLMLAASAASVRFLIVKSLNNLVDN
jgi:uncharacterized membrane protein